MKICGFCHKELELCPHPINTNFNNIRLTYFCTSCQINQDYFGYGEVYENDVLFSDSLRIDKFWIYRNYRDKTTYLFYYFTSSKVKLIKRWNFVMTFPLHNLEKIKRKLSIYTTFS